MKKVFVICAPTSSGKTSLALGLCKQFNGEIISSDSRQVYKHMDIGTGKVPLSKEASIKKSDTFWILDGVRIWAYDLVIPGQYFSAYDFVKFALPKAKELINAGKTLFLVGGTGFYIDVFTGRKKVANVPPDPMLRTTLSKMSLVELQESLKELDPDKFLKIDKQNKNRLIRAIEIRKSKERRSEALPYLADTQFIYIGLNAPRNVLYTRIDAWVDSVWNSGLPEETENLISLGFKDTPQMNGLVYKTVKGYLEGNMQKEEAVLRCKFDLHAYSRRQLTYFKGNTEITSSPLLLSTKGRVCFDARKINWFDITSKSVEESVKSYIIKLNE